MKKTYCNPLDLGYRYQHIHEISGPISNREGADPTLVLFKDIYYMFVSMSAGFWYSFDLLNWKFHANEKLLPYDYAPDARQIGDYLYFCASRRYSSCPILRTRDPLSDEFEVVSSPFPFWDPNLFCDEDGRVYLYWGCSNMDPIYGIELEPDTMLPIGEAVPLILGRERELGYERVGDNGVTTPKEQCESFQYFQQFINPDTGQMELPNEITHLTGYSSDELQRLLDHLECPAIEGAFMTKHAGTYYLQYASPGTEYNTYCDGVYVSDRPLGPYKLQRSNPFSSKPGGFIAGAGHGSTIMDKFGNYWHAATMRISVNHLFERRIGLFPAGFDKDGIMFCNQNFADYPFRIPEGKCSAFDIRPEWMLLSYGKAVSVSSGEGAKHAVDENIRTWWSADSADPGQWLSVDLGKVSDIRAIQVNIADEKLAIKQDSDCCRDERNTRCIEMIPQISEYRLDASADGKSWVTLEQVSRECSNGYFEFYDGIQARFVRITGEHLPYGQTLRVSGLRVFGNGSGDKPSRVHASAKRVSDLDALVQWNRSSDAVGYNVRYGIAADKLYMSWMVYDADEVKLSTLIKGQDYYVCVDSFNESGITEGNVIAISARVTKETQ